MFFYMVKIKKNITINVYFVFLLTFLSFTSCKTKENVIYEIKTSKIPIENTIIGDNNLEKYILPYRENITKDLSSVLAYNPVDQDKSKGKWETNIGNLFAESTFELANSVFKNRTGKDIDICLLNHGGIRSIIPKGDVTTKTAYDIMPFENSVIVVALTGDKIIDLAKYIIKERKPHPLFGLTIYTKDNQVLVDKILVNDKPIEISKVYYVATSDYLANGGDNMNFFTSSNEKYDIDYKLRNLFIDYFKKVDTIPNITTKHIIEE